MSREPERPSESELTPFQQVWNYISNTPENINPAILKQIIEKAYRINEVAAPHQVDIGQQPLDNP